MVTGQHTSDCQVWFKPCIYCQQAAEVEAKTQTARIVELEAKVKELEAKLSDGR